MSEKRFSISERAVSGMIKTGDLKEVIDCGHDCMLVDVRTTEEYLSGHIPGAVSMPLAELGAMDWGPDTGPVVLYCRSAMRSARALQLLLARGVREVAHLKGGIQAWAGAGGQVKRGG